MKAVKSLCLGMAFLLVSCSVPATPDSSLTEIDYAVGTLYLDPNADSVISGGVVQYRIYANGQIYYSGHLSYFGSDGELTEVQVPFSGTHRVAKKTASSATYRLDGSQFVEKKVSLQVMDYDASAAESLVSGAVTNSTKVDSRDATGQFLLDTSDDVIRIKDAMVKGTVFEGTPMETTLTLKFSETAY